MQPKLVLDLYALCHFWGGQEKENCPACWLVWKTKWCDALKNEANVHFTGLWPISWISPHTHKKEKNPKETQAKGRRSPLVLPRNSPISQRSPRVPIFCCKQCPFQSELYHRHTQRLGVRSNYPLQCGGAKATEYLVWFPNPLVARKVRWGPCLLNIHGTK